jgi:hypothetical protein
VIDDLLNAWGDSPADNRGDDAIVSITDNNRASIADPASGFFLDEVKDARVEVGVGGNPVHQLIDTREEDRGKMIRKRSVCSEGNVVGARSGVLGLRNDTENVVVSDVSGLGPDGFGVVPKESGRPVPERDPAPVVAPEPVGDIGKEGGVRGGLFALLGERRNTRPKLGESFGQSFNHRERLRSMKGGGRGEGVDSRLYVFFEAGDRSKWSVGLGVKEEEEVLTRWPPRAGGPVDVVEGGGRVEGRTVSEDGGGQVSLRTGGLGVMPEFRNHFCSGMDVRVEVPQLIHAGVVRGGSRGVGTEVQEKVGERGVLCRPFWDGVTSRMVLVEGVGKGKLNGNVVSDVGGRGGTPRGDGRRVDILRGRRVRARVVGEGVGARAHHLGVGSKDGRLGRSVGSEDRVDTGAGKGGETMDVRRLAVKSVEGLGDFMETPSGEHEGPGPSDRGGPDMTGVEGGTVGGKRGEIFVAPQELGDGRGVGGARPGWAGHDPREAGPVGFGRGGGARPEVKGCNPEGGVGSSKPRFRGVELGE